MPRPPRDLQPNSTYHITVRCNNRRFNLNRPYCRDVFLYAIEQAKQKYNFKLYGLCIMSNHVHYLLEPENPEELPKIMHWLNWYTAMSFNRMQNRTGHFWEQRYHSTGFRTDDHQRALNTLRYIHANPKAAGICRGYYYRYSNYGTYADLTDDGLTEWHPAFLHLGETLDECAAKYRRFCQWYQTKKKSGGRRSHWGGKQLPDTRRKQLAQPSKKAGQLPLPGYEARGRVEAEKECQVQKPDSLPETIQSVSYQFQKANWGGFGAW